MNENERSHVRDWPPNETAGSAMARLEAPRMREGNHEHCFHALRGPIFMVVPDGHIVQKCCKCEATRVIHADHAHEGGRRGT